MTEVVIIPTKDGPYHVKGIVTIKTKGGRIVEKVESETWLCRCGHSQSKPFCDGSHKKVGFKSDLDAEMAAAEAAAATDGYEDVGAAEEIPEGELKGVTVGDKPVVIGRVAGQLYAIGGVCTHQMALLADGELDGRTVVCPLHDSGFDITTGRAVRPPAVTAVPTYEVKIENGRALVAADAARDDCRRRGRIVIAVADSQTSIIVGANLAGGRAAETLRERGFAGRIILIGAEPDRPYERPPLSKGFLQGTYPKERLFLRPPEYYDENAIELRLGVRATGLNPAERTVTLDTGELLRYNKLLIATGTRVRRLQAPGMDLAGIFYLRTLGEAEEIAAELKNAQRVVVVGAGFIGSEVAASARMLGRDVTILEAAAVPLARALGPEMGKVCATIHRDHGVDLRLSCQVAAFRGSGRVEQVVLADGQTIDCDLVVVGVGVAPVVDWLAGSGIALDNGVVVDEYTQTSLPDVHAAGDVANWWNPLLGERLRVEHYDNAQNQGIAAANAMLGLHEPYAPVPYFWSDQYDLTLQYVGHTHGDEQIVIRGDVDARAFTAFYVAPACVERSTLDVQRGTHDVQVRGAFSIGRPRDVTAARRLIRARKAVDPTILADEQTDLRALARTAEPA